jgi:predicted DCC family thiol-disulfide oxidoreductase YuxK
MAGPERVHVIFYDGVCGLCDRLVQWVLVRDRDDRFRFAALQSQLAKTVLPLHGKDPRHLDTLYVIADHEGPRERVLQKSRAALFVLSEIGGRWRLIRPLGWLPTFVLDLGYDVIAKTRYRIFGKLDECRVPTPSERRKFIDLEAR